jgi:hypothetical protein
VRFKVNQIAPHVKKIGNKNGNGRAHKKTGATASGTNKSDARECAMEQKISRHTRRTHHIASTEP